jgi:hypothetical protein
MACIIDMSSAEFENKRPTYQDFKTFNKSGPDIENQLAVVKEYQEAAEEAAKLPRTPLSPLVNIFSRVSVFSFLPIFGVM